MKKSRTEISLYKNQAIFFQKGKFSAKIQNAPVGVVWQEEAKEKNCQAGDWDETHWIWI